MFLATAGQKNIFSSLKKCIHMQVSFCKCKISLLQSFRKDKSPANQWLWDAEYWGWPSLLYMFQSVYFPCESLTPSFRIFWKKEMHFALGILYFTSCLLSPRFLSGLEICRLMNTCVFLKEVQAWKRPSFSHIWQKYFQNMKYSNLPNSYINI